MPEAVTTSPAHRGLAQQGFYELSTDELGRLDNGLRFTPAVMLLAAAAGLATRQPVLHATLAVIGAIALLLPRLHPVDLAYNHLLRHLVRAPALPPNPLPRRLAGGAAAALNLAICLAFTSGRGGLGYGLGTVLLILLTLLATRHLCLSSWMLETLVVAKNRPDRLITGDEARRLVADGALLIDVRSPKEFANGHLPGAVNVPVDEFAQHVAELVAERREMVLYCAAGVRCNKAAVMLREAGSTDVHQLGTLARWSETG
jgi:rhodanese-related sulfurtransferase